MCEPNVVILYLLKTINFIKDKVQKKIDKVDETEMEASESLVEDLEPTENHHLLQCEEKLKNDDRVNISKILENDASWVYSMDSKKFMSDYTELKKKIKKQSNSHCGEKYQLVIQYRPNNQAYITSIHKLPTNPLMS